MDQSNYEISADNYAFITEANRNGVKLRDISTKLTALEKECIELRKAANESKTPTMTAELFAVQQEIVKVNPNVINARTMLARVKEEALARILISDDKAYQTAHEAYVAAVNSAYLEYMKGTGHAIGTEIKTTE
jgi:hypothetical protein